MTTCTDINQDPIAPPSFLDLNEGQKALLFKHEIFFFFKYVWLMDLNKQFLTERLF